jgi:hypothetical protein
MKALDEYLDAVGTWLPAAQRADIVAEPGEDLRSEIKERESSLGRALSDDELLALLQRRGHPMWVAESYLPKRQLIGPAMLPLYFRALKVACAVLAAIFGVLMLAFTVFVKGASPELAQPRFWIWQLGLWSFAYVGLFTTIFALVERRQLHARAADACDPRAPRALPSMPTDDETRSRSWRPIWWRSRGGWLRAASWRPSSASC